MLKNVKIHKQQNHWHFGEKKLAEYQKRCELCAEGRAKGKRRKERRNFRQMKTGREN